MRSLAAVFCLLLLQGAAPSEAQGIALHGERIEKFEPDYDLSGYSAPALVRVLDSGNDEMRVSAVWELGRLTDPYERKLASEALLKTFFDDGNATVQRFAGDALEKLLDGPGVDVQPFRDACLDRAIARVADREQDATLRAQAATLLGLLKHSRATDALLVALDDPSLHLRCRAAAALGLCGNISALKPLRERRDSLPEDSQERGYAEAAVQRLIARLELLAAGTSIGGKKKKK